MLLRLNAGPDERALRVLDLDVRLETEGRFGAELDVWYAGFERSSRTPSHDIVLRHDGTAHVLTVDGAVVAESSVGATLLPHVVLHMNRVVVEQSQWVLVHAGAVARDGVVVVLPGTTGAGKSTLTAGLVRAGWQYLSDEVAALAGEGAIAEPYPKPISLDRGAWGLFPELEPRDELALGGPSPMQWMIPPARIRADAVGSPARVGVVMFPRHAAGAPTKIEPLSRADALLRLADNTFRFVRRPKHCLEHLAAVVREAECYRLTAGSLHEAVAAVEAVAGRAPVGAGSSR